MSVIECDINDWYNQTLAIFQDNIDYNFGVMCEKVYGAADDSAKHLRAAKGIWSQEDSTPERERLLYEKGWKAYKYRPVDGEVTAVVANATIPQLTHLIEKGHELFLYGKDTGRRTKARPHIKEAFEYAKAKHFGGGGTT